MVSTIGAALSGYAAATARLETSANNIANANTTTTLEGGEIKRESYTPQRVVQSSNAEGGVSYQREDVSPASFKAYAPGDAGADENGITNRPNVDTSKELVNSIIASYDAKANLRVLKAETETLKSVLNIIA